MSEFNPHPIPDGKVEMNGKTYMTEGDGSLRPIEMIKPQELLEHETAVKILGYWIALSEQVARQKAHVLSDLDAFEAILAQEYGSKIGGKKGNKTIFSFDRLHKVEVRINDMIDFGPELQIAKALVDECLNEWAEDARPELRAIITNAFNTEQEGKVNRAEIVKLTKLPIEEPRWIRAMEAIRDAQRVIGSKLYVRCARRETFDGEWEYITVDMAKA